MKKFLLLLSLFSIAAFADHGCYNSREVSYKATELAREAKQMAHGGRFSRHGHRFIQEANRLAWAAWGLAQAATSGMECRRLERRFHERVEPAFKHLMQEVRGHRRDDYHDDLRDISRAFQDLRRELMEDNGRWPRGPGHRPGPHPGPFPHPGPDHGPGHGPDHGPRH